MPNHIRTGLDSFLAVPPPEVHGARLGLLMNQASVNHEFRYACDLLAERFPGQLRMLFSPQHGLQGEQQANMIESPDSRYAPLNLPVCSLYAETRRPPDSMLADIDCLVIDLQDVGTRVYTFVWTMLECLRACVQNNVRVVVLDRPNPLGGEVIEGPMLEKDFRSFVGGSEVPLRHGLTIGELARLLNSEERIDAELTVVPMGGWDRTMLFPDTGLPWVPPSPNMPRWQTALLYPGQVLLEGTSLSEGRGTTTPFEVIGAPALDPDQLLAAVRRDEHPGIALQAIRFQPTFDKWRRQICGGLAIHVLDAAAVRSVGLTITLIDVARQLAPDNFTWLQPPYEYEYKKPPIDILFGNDQLRNRLNSDDSIDRDELTHLLSYGNENWRERVSMHLIYADRAG
ncbi:MAG: DUF1343 domain-containing protein [Fuerstiella sp.]|nr:DUF1343 domain-containing protein [Fuerstiella sp.]